MVPYLVVAVIPVFWGLITFRRDLLTKPNIIKIIVATLPLFLLIALRDETIGADTGMYANSFRRMIGVPWEKIDTVAEVEYGYLIFIKLCTLITSNYNEFQCIYTLICYLCFLRFLLNLEEKPYWTIFFYATIGIYTFMFTGVRQCLAMSFCLFSYKYVKKRKLIRFALCVALAFFFHKSAILFAVVYFIYPRKFSAWNVVLYIFISLIFLINLEAFQNFFAQEFDYEYQMEFTNTGYITSIFISVVSVVSMIILWLNKGLTKENTGLFNLSIITIVLWIARIFTRTVERPSYYFMFFTCAMISAALQSIKNKKDREIVSFIFFLAFMGLFAYRLSIATLLVPYKTFF